MCSLPASTLIRFRDTRCSSRISSCTFGVSILDTRHLVKLLALEHEGRLSCAISSYRFTLGDSKYCQRARNKFLFGKSKSAESIPELKLELEQLVEDRDAVLVCHSTNCELKMLRNLDIDLRPLYIIDTNKVAQYVLQLHYRYDLGKLLGVLGIPYALLHAAGNDARFCLQALLMLAVKDAEMGPPDSADEALLRMPEGISHAPRPRTRGEIDAALASGRQARKEAKAARKIEKRATRVAAKIEQLRLEREREDTQAAGLNSEETGSITGELPQDT